MLRAELNGVWDVQARQYSVSGRTSQGEKVSSRSESIVDRSSAPSRQGSFATSINSSIYTTDSKLPPGQQRLDDGTHSHPYFTSAVLISIDVPSTHHHSMQHRSVTSLQAIDPTNPLAPGSGSYSRTPELRVSHKMAERKRRSEMKTLFDDLNGILPNSPGSKSSKWEILTKGNSRVKLLRIFV